MHLTRTRGSVEPEFVQRLMRCIERPIFLLFAWGLHECSLCTAEGREGPDERTSQAQLLIPARQFVYEAPIWIGHYVIDHAYRPPDEFRHAVLTCPAPGSREFADAVLIHTPDLCRAELARALPAALFCDWQDTAPRTLRSDPKLGPYAARDERSARPPEDQQLDVRVKSERPPYVGCAWPGCYTLAREDVPTCHEHSIPEHSQ